jgi:CubicO group peptidase (beta-lactamase class C family)
MTSDFILDKRFGRVADVFDAQIARGLHFGAQICIRYQGEIVVDRYKGYRDSSHRWPVGSDTPFMVYSATKALIATCIHMLREQGILDLNAPVATYWPEFAANGKEGITIAHVLLHQAGIPNRGNALDAALWLFPQGGERRVAAMKPVHAPGTKCLYHSFTAGFVLGELIRRTTGSSPAGYLEKHFLAPLGMESSYAGLPPRLYRIASRIYSGDPSQRSPALVFSNPLYRSLFIPAASLNTTAQDLALFYQMLCDGGSFSGKKYLSPETIANATRLRYEGPDGDSGRIIRWAYGFGLGGYSPFQGKDIRHMGQGATEKTFGHSGQGGCGFGWADPPSSLVFAFTCNRFLDLESAHLRFQELADACWKSL